MIPASTYTIIFFINPPLRIKIKKTKKMINNKTYHDRASKERLIVTDGIINSPTPGTLLTFEIINK